MKSLVLCRTLMAIAVSSCLNGQQVLSRTQPASKRNQVERLGVGPLSFIENRGQFDADVKFQAKSGGKILWFTSTGIVFDVQRPVSDSKSGVEHGPKTAMFSRASESALFGGKFERLVFAEDFASANVSPNIEASAAQPGIYNYFIGNAPKNWRAGVVGYSQVLYHDVWPGIDVRFVVKEKDIEQEFLVHPGADASLIRISYRGAKGLQVAGDGSLIVQTAFGPLREGTPRIYQEDRGRRTSVRGKYKISGELAYAFQLGSYRKTNTLVIDPTLLYSTYLGGSGLDSASGIAVDSSGHAYVTGYTQSTNFPTTPGAFETTATAGQYVFVTKLNALGSALVYSTYLSNAVGIGIAVDSAGEAYVAGGGAGAGFPTTSSAFQTACFGGAFFTKLNATGSGLIYSTCLGESDDAFVADTAFSVAVGPNGQAYLAGYCGSAYPTTGGAFQTAFAGSRDAFVTVIDPTLSGSASLIYSSRIGGGGSGNNTDNYSEAVAVDAFGNAYVAGSTTSPNFPTTPGAYQTNYTGGACYYGPCYNVFVAKFNPSFSGTQSLIYSTYLGGNGGGAGIWLGDTAQGIAVDALGNAYVTGETNSPNFPLTPGAYSAPSISVCYPNCTPGFQNVFVTKLNSGGSGLVYSSQIGNTGLGRGYPAGDGIAVNSSSEVYVVGDVAGQGGAGSPFPVTPDAFQPVDPFYNNHGFISKLNAQGSGLVYSSFLGGTAADGIQGIAIDGVGDAYVAGGTASINFPTTPSAVQPAAAGAGDAFITKFPLGAPGGLSITGILPNAGGNAGTLSPEIIGSGFHAGATVALVVGLTQILGSSVTVGSEGRTIATSFNLIGVSAGNYDLVITNPDGTSVRLPQGFTVLQGGSPQVWVDIVGPSTVRTGEPHTFDIVVGNSGAVDSAAGSLWVSLPAFVTWSLSGGQEFSELYQDSAIVRFILLLPPVLVGRPITIPLTIIVVADGVSFQITASANLP